MSRLYTHNSQGRQPMLGSPPRLSKSKEYSHDTFHGPTGKKNKTHRRHAFTHKLAGKRKRADRSASEEEISSTAGSETADDASDEDSDESDDDDDEDLPAVTTPSRSRSLNGAGPKPQSTPRDNVSIAGSLDSMFGEYEDYYEDDEDPNFSPEENRKRFESKVFAESDNENDDIYQAVDDISDFDDDLDDNRIEEHELLAMLSEEDHSDADFLLNQIDGLSAYGFGDESDVSIHRFPSSQASDSTAETGPERRVHFAVEGDRSLYMRMSESPTITRALLPSALPDSGFSNHDAERRTGGLVDDLDDSDLTDDCLPEEALQGTPNGLQPERDISPSVTPPSKKMAKKPNRRRGPPRGIFIDEGDKTSGILDRSGKIILMTNPHLLGEEFARRYGVSQASSPDVGFAELIEESDIGERDSTDLVGAPSTDIMLASLNSALNDPTNLGQAVGPLEVFYPADSLVLGDYAIDPDELEEDFRPEEGLGEDVINLHDVIQFDDDTDDSDAPTSPIFMPPPCELSGIGNVSNEFAHLNNNNVTAFRRNADPAFAALSNMPSFRDTELFGSPFATPAPRRKRKNHASPYTSSHYKGVTPVQRMWDPNQPQTPDSSTPAKRRRIMI
ncbi:uncharacterized protein Z518_06561 [Rhinocladiella mackenziei CBS 650.93]|uniref:Rhinocladiella mackenziei CBS 650.93 unplaced genomic scaffold supercont1.5, whole genome shotgun sequence n=1 Tax=Rhinocladiella mackenziei CBS 650.93 TaxID=1442369 RepID=A0A0D2IIC5_9EURO|nr:uncharacterized protein Z518_06561 [Rhinocladiella mackenziei CBS 650.93]KIX03011.1 hypothetical protein Z518_06561 [Rhinocladiella mackenziei CBS 650.93]